MCCLPHSRDGTNKRGKKRFSKTFSTQAVKDEFTNGCKGRLHDRLYGTSIPLAVRDYSAPQTEGGKYTTGCKRPVHHRLYGMSAPKVVRMDAPQAVRDERTTD